MPELSQQQLNSELKNNQFHTSYLIYGTEAYLKQHYANLIAKKCVSSDMEGFNLRKFDAQNGVDFNALYESTDTLPMFSEHCCTFMKDMPLDSLYSENEERFESWLREMPETTVAVFWQDSDDINPKKNAKWKKVTELFTKYGAAVCLDKMDSASLIKTVMGGIKKRGCEIDRATAVYLTENVGNDLNLLLNEVEKLASYKGSGVITREDIDVICIKSLEANVFDLSKAINSRQLERAYEIITKLFDNKERPEMILGALCGNYIDMYRVKTALLEGKDFEYFKDIYQYKNKAFRLKYARNDCNRLSLEQIENCIRILNKADISIKSSFEDGKIIIERLILELYRETQR